MMYTSSARSSGYNVRSDLKIAREQFITEYLGKEKYTQLKLTARDMCNKPPMMMAHASLVSYEKELCMGMGYYTFLMDQCIWVSGKTENTMDKASTFIQMDNDMKDNCTKA